MKKKNIRATREALKAQKIKKSQENEALKKQKLAEEAAQKRREELEKKNLAQWEETSAEGRRSRVKAVGVKSVFVVGDDLYLATFGNGNETVLEKKITPDGKITTFPEEETFTAKLKFAQTEPTVATSIGISNGRIVLPEISVDNPLHTTMQKNTIKRSAGEDILQLKDVLENRYFDRSFNDDLHIRLIYNILDIEKILAEYTTNAVFAIDNVSGCSDDFLSNFSTRNQWDEFQNPEQHREHFGNKDNVICSVKKQQDLFFNFFKNNRIGYFGKAFFHAESERKIVKKTEKEVYHILTLIGSLRQWITHSTEGGISRLWLYQLEDALSREYQETMNNCYNSTIYGLQKDFEKTNAPNLNFLAEILGKNASELAEPYFRFIITKEYKNLGFSIKTLREMLLDQPDLQEIRENHNVYDSIRSKLYKMIDFVLVYAYSNERKSKADALASNLRSAITEDAKKRIYQNEADQLWTSYQELFKRIRGFKGAQVKEYSSKNMPIPIQKQIQNILKPAEQVTYFTKLMYLLTMFLDGKEINDLLTTLINKFDNISSLLKTMEQLELQTTFKEDYTFFQQSSRLCKEITQLKSFARMGNPISNLKEVMIVDAIQILGTEKSEQELQSMACFFFRDKNGKKLNTGEHGMRNFIGNNVISNTRFQYLIRYGNPQKLHTLSQNETVVRFVLSRIAKNQRVQGMNGKNQIDRYYETCGGTNSWSVSEEEKINFLCKILTNMSYDQFQDVKQSGAEITAEEKRKKERYKAIISLYLTVLYQLIKNLVNINARYIIAFHCLERDAILYSSKFNTSINLKKRYTALTEMILGYETDEKARRKDTRTVYEKAEAAKNRHLKNVKWNCKTRENLENADKNAIVAFRNIVAHLWIIRDADRFITGMGAMKRYFDCYHYLLQRELGYILEKSNQGSEYTKKSLEKVQQYHSYCKDFLHMLCLPFAYCIPRYKNLSIAELFDRHEPEAEPKEEASSVNNSQFITT